MKLYSIYDRATESYGPVMTMRTNGEAIRSLQQALKDNNSMVAQKPSDYELYCVGQWDEQTGEISGFEEGPEMIARAEDHAS